MAEPIKIRATQQGELTEIRVLMQHPMETGFRFDDVGRRIARNVITSVECRYNGTEVFSASLSSGISANPYLSFFIVAANSGELRFDWVDDSGVTGSERSAIIVAG